MNKLDQFKKVVVIDDNLSIRYALSRIFKSILKDAEIFTAQDGIEGLGLIFATQPDLIVLDLTLPKYSGREIIEYIQTNPTLNKKTVKVLLLHSEKFVDKDFPYKVFDKSTPHIGFRLQEKFFERKSSFIQKIKFTILGEIIHFANKSDRLLSTKLVSPIKWIFWSIYQIITSFYLSLSVLFIGRAADSNVNQLKLDNFSFRIRTYPTIVGFLSSFIFVILQLSLFIAGGATILRFNMQSIFALSLNDKTIIFNAENSSRFKYDENKFEFSEEGVKLKEVSTEIQEPESQVTPTPTLTPTEEPIDITPTPTEEVLPIPEDVLGESTSDASIEQDKQSSTKYPIGKPYIEIKEPIELNDLTNIKEIATNEPDKTELTYQFSPNGESWYYLEGESWTLTEQLWSSSNTLKSIENSIESLKTDVLTTNEIYFRIFFDSKDGKFTPILKELEFLNGNDILTVNPEIKPFTPEQIDPDTITEDKFTLKDHYAEVFNASFFKGEKVVKGKVLFKDKWNIPNYELSPEYLDKFAVNIYFSSPSTSTKDKLIGATNLQINSRGEIEFLLRRPSTPGGYVVAEILNTETNESIISEPVENSTFTVDSGGDGADSGIDGLCDNGSGVCTLRASIEESNANAAADTIEFAIPTSDASCRDYDTPNTATSCDGSGGDDYWTIRPATALPNVSDAGSDFMGGTQTTTIGDTNTSGPEIEISFQSLAIGGSVPWNIANNDAVISSFVFNYSNGTNAGPLTFSGAGNEVNSSYFGIDIKGLALATNHRTALNLTGDGSIIGNGISDGNVFGDSTSGFSSLTATCGAGSPLVADIRGNFFGVNRDDVSIPNGIGLTLSGSCDALVDGNIFASSSNYSLALNPSATNNYDIDIYNNKFGTDETGTLDRENAVDIFLIGTNYTGLQDPIEIGASGNGNLFRYSNVNIRLGTNRSVYIMYNTIAGYGIGIDMFPLTPTGAFTMPVQIERNFIGLVTASDPYFGLNLNDTHKTVLGEGYGIKLAWGYGIIIGNIIKDYGIGIYASPDGLNTKATTADDGYVAFSIGGQTAYVGSLCMGSMMNCIEDNGNGSYDPLTNSTPNNNGAGILFVDAVPTNESTLYTDNSWGVGNGPGNDFDILQSWAGKFELFSDDERRTALSSATLNLPSGNFFHGSTSLSKINIVCSAPSTITCPAAGSTNGLLGQTAVFGTPSGNFTKIAQYYYDHSGTQHSLGQLKFDEPHFASQNFTFDGDSTTDPVSGDRAETWTDNTLADRDLPTQTFGHYQLMELEYVDANPIFNGTDWVITVDSTGDEDNVSILGYDDGSGAYSGGGLEGLDGISDGSTSLKEAIIVANNFSQPVRIEFNIPTTDANYEDADGGAGDGLDGDDYWSIKQNGDKYPTITNTVNIAGASQTTNQGDTNIYGPEIEIDGTGSLLAGTRIILQGDNSIIDSIIINNYAFDVLAVEGDNSQVTNTYLGLNAIGDTAQANTGSTVFAVAGDNCLIDSNVISGNSGNGLSLIGVTNTTVTNNIIGLDSTGTFALPNNAGISLSQSSSNNQIGSPNNPNIISGNNLTGITINTSSTNIIQSNIIGLDISANTEIPNGSTAISISASFGASTNNLIGGDNEAEGNIISGSPNDGIRLITIFSGTNDDNTFKSNIILNSTDSPIDISNNGPTTNDAGDIDTGINDLMNYPVIDNVIYLGGGYYRLYGSLDFNASEGPFTIEVCESDSNSLGYGGCADTFGFTTTADGNWYKDVQIPSSNGLDSRSFTALATNNQGSTSEFSANFDAIGANPDYEIANYTIDLVFPINNQTISTNTPILDWSSVQYNNITHPLFSYYNIYVDGTFRGTTSNTDLNINTPLSEGEHSWYVRAYDNLNNIIATSTTETFIVDAIPNTTTPTPTPIPGNEVEYSITLVYPVNITVDTSRPYFDWTESTLDSDYLFDIFIDGKLAENDLSSSEYRLADGCNLTSENCLLKDGEHTWSITVFEVLEDNSRQSIFTSGTAKFTVKLPSKVDTNPDVIETGDDEENTPSLPEILKNLAENSDKLSPQPLIVLSGIMAGSALIYGPLNALKSVQMIGFIVGLFIKRKKKYWGFIIDSSNDTGISFAVVRVYKSTAPTQIKQTVSDLEGKYGLTVDEPGNYVISVSANGYIDKDIEVEIGNDLEIIKDIYLERSFSDSVSHKFKYKSQTIFDFINNVFKVLISIGFVYSLIALYYVRTPLNFFFIALYGVLFLINFIMFLIAKNLKKGKVFEIDSNNPIPGTSVRLYEQNGNQVIMDLSDKNGNIKFNIPVGEYNVLGYKRGYRMTGEDSDTSKRSIVMVPIKIKSDGYMDLNILMRKVEENYAESNNWNG